MLNNLHNQAQSLKVKRRMQTATFCPRDQVAVFSVYLQAGVSPSSGSPLPLSITNFRSKDPHLPSFFTLTSWLVFDFFSDTFFLYTRPINIRRGLKTGPQRDYIPTSADK